ncbi:hypothetical protein [[Phormidium] sp. ETS-05]|uniref:hypothetical protein n=1 Tax=[Phormidium] sp. ETS-05 TaxID=222819 RepID=UPI0018EECCA0|nr:hypothetical protein [[Phormidium] sp. ETS-05]
MVSSGKLLVGRVGTVGLGGGVVIWVGVGVGAGSGVVVWVVGLGVAVDVFGEVAAGLGLVEEKSSCANSVKRPFSSVVPVGTEPGAGVDPVPGKGATGPENGGAVPGAGVALVGVLLALSVAGREVDARRLNMRLAPRSVRLKEKMKMVPIAEKAIKMAIVSSTPIGCLGGKPGSDISFRTSEAW